MINQNIKNEVIKTIIFFDMFDFPMTGYEIWRYLGLKSHLNDVLEALEQKIAGIEQKNGFYFLTGRGEIIEKRMKRYNYANRKYKRAIRIARFFKFIPWIKMVAIGNIIGPNNMKDEGDIDFFIITEKNKIWLTRFFAAGFLKVLNLRPTPENKQDKICLSFYINEENLNIKNLMIYGRDPYFVHWIAGLLPIFEIERCYSRFIDANRWVYVYFPNWQPAVLGYRLSRVKEPPFAYKIVFNLLFGGFETIAKNFQIKIMPAVLKENINKGTAVVVNESVIKLYVHDKRMEVSDNYELRVKRNVQMLF